VTVLVKVSTTSLSLKIEFMSTSLESMESKLTDVVNDTSRQESRDIGRGLDECADRDGSNSRVISLSGSRNECAEIGHRHRHRLLEGLGLHDSSLKSA
jgi:hypothetical protein